MAKLFFMMVLLTLSPVIYADYFYSEHEKGWYWFDDPKEIKVSKNTLQEEKPKNPEDKILFVQKQLKKTLDQAILEPTPEHIEAYILLQNQVNEQANLFANAWQRVLLNRPELNYALIHPTNNVALKVYHEGESKKKIEVIHDFAKQSGLFFFYRSSCPYCQRFSPILKHFIETYHIALVPITTDGKVLPEFPYSRQDDGQAKQFHVSLEPALYAVDPQTQKVFPVAIGLVSESELLDDLYNGILQYRRIS